MNSTRFKIAEHVFEIESQEVDIVKLLPNLEPFLTDEEQEPLFYIKIDNSINPSWRGSRIGFFPCRRPVSKYIDRIAAPTRF